jgi:hypothetical protein
VAVTGALAIELPALPAAGKNWSLTVKVVHDGTNTPTFAAPGGATLKWHANTTPTPSGTAGHMNIYTFISDATDSEIHGALAWKEA